MRTRLLAPIVLLLALDWAAEAQEKRQCAVIPVQDGSMQSTFLGATSTGNGGVAAFISTRAFNTAENAGKLEFIRIDSLGEITNRVAIANGVNYPYTLAGVTTSKLDHVVAVFTGDKGETVVTGIDLATLSDTSVELKASGFSPSRVVPLRDGTVAILGRRGLRGAIVRLSGTGDLVSIYDVSDPSIQLMYDGIDTAQGLIFLAGSMSPGASLESRNLFLGRMNASGKVLSKRILTSSHRDTFGIAEGQGAVGLLFDETKSGVLRLTVARLVGDSPEDFIYQPIDTAVSAAGLVGSTPSQRVIAMLSPDRDLVVEGVGAAGRLWTCVADIHQSREDMATNFFPVGDRIAFTHWAINDGKLRQLLKIMVLPKN